MKASRSAIRRFTSTGFLTSKSNGKESKEKVYFVIETKGTTDEAGRRVFENQKIECAMRHFEVVDVKYKAVANYSDFAREL